MDLLETLGLGGKVAEENVVYYALYPDSSTCAGRSLLLEASDCHLYWMRPAAINTYDNQSKLLAFLGFSVQGQANLSPYTSMTTSNTCLTHATKHISIRFSSYDTPVSVFYLEHHDDVWSEQEL